MVKIPWEFRSYQDSSVHVIVQFAFYTCIPVGTSSIPSSIGETLSWFHSGGSIIRWPPDGSTAPMSRFHTAHDALKKDKKEDIWFIKKYGSVSDSWQNSTNDKLFSGGGVGVVKVKNSISSLHVYFIWLSYWKSVLLQGAAICQFLHGRHLTPTSRY